MNTKSLEQFKEDFRINLGSTKQLKINQPTSWKTTNLTSQHALNRGSSPLFAGGLKIITLKKGPAQKHGWRSKTSPALYPKCSMYELLYLHLGSFCLGKCRISYIECLGMEYKTQPQPSSHLGIHTARFRTSEKPRHGEGNMNIQSPPPFGMTKRQVGCYLQSAQLFGNCFANY